MELVLTSPDPSNADYLDPRTMTPVFRVMTMSKKRSSLGAETTVVQMFQQAGQQQQAPSQHHQQANVYHHQHQFNGHQQYTHSGSHGGYSASPYGIPPQPGPAPSVIQMPQAYHAAPAQPTRHQQPPAQRPQPSQSANQPVITCQIEWHSLKDTLFHWADGRGKVAADKVISSSGFMQRKRKFAARTGRTYAWSENGSLQSETKVPLGSFVNSNEDLQTRWDAQPVSALRWGAYLSIEQGVPMEDVADVVAVLAYSQKKTKNNEEIAKAVGEAGSAAGGAVG